MKICILAKKNKPYVKEIIYLTKKHFHNTEVYLGINGDKYPKKLNDKKYDIIISYLSPWILSKKTLSKTKLFNINFHPGPPEYPGIGCYNFAIFNGASNYGVTAHIMEDKVDTGKIIKVKRFKINKKITVDELILKSYLAMFNLYNNILIDFIIKKKINYSEESWKRRPYTRKQFNKLLIIKNNMTKSEIKKRIQSTSVKGYPGAYIMIKGSKFQICD